MTAANTRLARIAQCLTVAAFVSFAASRPATAATTEELEAKLQALASQVQALQSEVATLKAQNAAAASSRASAPAVASSSGSSGAIVSGNATPSTSDSSGGRLSWLGYGELNYSRPTDDNSASSADVGRFVLGALYRFDDRTRLVSELEVEHAVASSDDSGEIEVEQVWLERQLTNSVYAKLGLFLIPSGMLNESHEPTRYYGVFRNFVETAIIPTTWREGGIALQGNTDSGLRWDVGVTTGFDLSKWDATATEGQESPLGSIHQELVFAHAKDLSGFAALNYTGIAGLRAGASVFTGGASQGQPGLPSADITLWEGHVRWTPGAWDFAGLYAHGQISGTREINATLVGNPTLIPQSFFGWYLQAAYRLFDTERTSLTPFVRYERFNTASSYADIGLGLTPNVLPDRKVWTAGLNWMFAPGVVFKLDYLDFQDTSEGDRFGIGLGYQF